MVSWSEVERVLRNGSEVTEQVNGHTLVKIYRLRNGGRIRDSGSNLEGNSSLPRDETKYRTSWKCDDCGTEFSSARSANSYDPCSG